MLSDGRLVAAVFRGGSLGYDVARSLCRHGVETYLLTSKNLRDGKYPGAKILLSPSHATPQGAEQLATFINATVAPERNVVLLPTSDDSALFLARWRSRLDPRFLYLMPDAALVDALDNKMLFYALCQRHGLPYAETWILRDKSEFASVVDRVPIPCIIKPFRSREWPKSLGYKVAVAESADALRAIVLEGLSHGCQIILQDMIPGGAQDTVFVGGLYDDSSKPVKLYVGRKLLQYPLDIGSTCFAELVWNQDVVDLTNAFVKRIGYCGLIDIEFMRDPRDGAYKIIEVNPRHGLWHRISDDGHWDITSYYVYWMCGRGDCAGGYLAHEEGRHWIRPPEHLCSRIQESGLLKGAVLWCRDMRQTKLRCAWDIRDLRRNWRSVRMVLGHVRHLGLRALAFGRNGGYSTKRRTFDETLPRRRSASHELDRWNP